ncbi:uncharacterized protein LOC119731312 [Patiria miniata]|uniref:Uncharacterized protein n=1 Tax=Patiria miniata TaxID=46514 RepID=A0A914A969_PATMI|nr:uncharacterized protein LOC119731312 [Patiria miniata]
MPPKREKKQQSVSESTISPEAACAEPTVAHTIAVDDKSTTPAGNSLLAALRSEIRDMKSGIEGKLDLVISNQHSLLHRIDEIESRHTEIEKSVSYTSEAIEDVRAASTNQQSKLTKLTSELDVAESKITRLEETAIRLERYSRSYNLRFGGIAELPNERADYPYEKIKQILKEKCDMEPEIENAHRSGRPTQGKTRHILAKFMYRPERQAVLLKAKAALSGCGIYLIEDLPAADLIKKKSLKEIMHKAYVAGKKPIFRNGQLYINGQRFTPDLQPAPRTD